MAVLQPLLLKEAEALAMAEAQEERLALALMQLLGEGEGLPEAEPVLLWLLLVL